MLCLLGIYVCAALIGTAIGGGGAIGVKGICEMWDDINKTFKKKRNNSVEQKDRRLALRDLMSTIEVAKKKPTIMEQMGIAAINILSMPEDVVDIVIEKFRLDTFRTKDLYQKDAAVETALKAQAAAADARPLWPDRKLTLADLEYAFNIGIKNTSSIKNMAIAVGNIITLPEHVVERAVTTFIVQTYDAEIVYLEKILAKLLISAEAIRGVVRAVEARRAAVIQDQ